MEKLKLQKAGLATLLAFSLTSSAATLYGCSSKSTDEQTEEQVNEEESQELTFNPNVQEGDYVEGQNYIFEPYTHNLKYGFAAQSNGQIKVPNGYELFDADNYGTAMGHTYRVIYTNVETVEVTATYNPIRDVVECWQPGTPIEKENEPVNETSYQKTYAKNQ